MASDNLTQGRLSNRRNRIFDDNQLDYDAKPATMVSCDTQQRSRTDRRNRTFDDYLFVYDANPATMVSCDTQQRSQTDRRNRTFHVDPLVYDANPAIVVPCEILDKDEVWTGKKEKRPIWHWEEVQKGTMVYLKYRSFWHAVLVTDVNTVQNEISGIHYACGITIFHDREIREDTFQLDLEKGQLWEVKIPVSVRVSQNEAVERGRNLLGERNYSMLTRRSSHIVLECILKNSKT